MGIFKIIDEIVYGKEGWLERADRLMKQDTFFFDHNGNVSKRVNQDEQIIKKVGKLEINNANFNKIILEGAKWMN